MNKLKYTIFTCLALVIVVSCSGVKDIDGNTYKTVKIGKQVWMAENLKVTHYRNSDPIPNLVSHSEYWNAENGGYCNYKNDENNADTYGRLYNWLAINDSRGIAPKGWHVPTDEEWQQLEIALGMNPADADSYFGRGEGIGGSLKTKGTKYWKSPNTGATNKSRFSALPAGHRPLQGYQGLGSSAYFWTSTEYSYEAWYRRLIYDDSKISRSHGYTKLGVMSVRCVKD